MTKTIAIFNGVVFYVSMLVFALFLCGGCETLFWYFPTAICGLAMWRFSKIYTENDWRVFTGVNFIQKKYNVDLFSEE